MTAVPEDARPAIDVSGASAATTGGHVDAHLRPVRRRARGEGRRGGRSRALGKKWASIAQRSVERAPAGAHALGDACGRPKRQGVGGDIAGARAGVTSIEREFRAAGPGMDEPRTPLLLSRGLFPPFTAERTSSPGSASATPNRRADAVQRVGQRHLRVEVRRLCHRIRRWQRRTGPLRSPWHARHPRGCSRGVTKRNGILTDGRRPVRLLDERSGALRLFQSACVRGRSMKRHRRPRRYYRPP